MFLSFLSGANLLFAARHAGRHLPTNVGWLAVAKVFPQRIDGRISRSRGRHGCNGATGQSGYQELPSR